MSAASRSAASAAAHRSEPAIADSPLALLPLVGQLVEQRRGVGVRRGRTRRGCDRSGPSSSSRRRRVATKPATLFLGSGSVRSDRTVGRSASGTASSSPTIETSRRALRIPRLDENSRYTVAGGTSDRALIASIVVAP